MSPKKILPIICVTLLIILSYFTVLHNRQAISEIKPVQYYDEVLKDHKLLDKLKNEYIDIFAGYYIDDEGKSNLNFVKGADITEIKDSIRDAININYVKFSLNYLEEIIELLNDKMTELDIAVIELNQKENRVVVYLKDVEETKINKIKAIIDSSAIEFKEMIGKLQLINI
ncbi:hypothetical protein [Oceanirhabdus sp. W0125-5]|uniref:hypothetical protein n=1 Tax=Oceanirhabdus sp. W0125-5 TaxID=2999116 RepID=UPI0022F2EC57|nr:hypothetical protein [Oceanirhabdus sp. W0125-5]WBW97502.1 hypothetical protein OW730_01220 [Oceanirhabdus sp. W0125-5]